MIGGVPERNLPATDRAVEFSGNPTFHYCLIAIAVGQERITYETHQQYVSHLGSFFSGSSLGGKVSRYRKKQNIYTQGAPADTLFYIQEGAVWLTTRTKHQPSAVTAILGVNDFFGELCLAGYPLRMSTAVALTASSIRTIKKEKMLQTLRKKNKTSNSLVAYLLTRGRVVPTISANTL